MKISDFIVTNFRHYNSATLVDAAKAFKAHGDSGKKMLLAMGGAMSTAEIGITLAKMIRQDKIHAVSCSSNNLEEDIFNLVAHDLYERVPNYRDLTPQDEQNLLNRHMNRVTDTCIPEEEAFRKIEKPLAAIWKKHHDDFVLSKPSYENVNEKFRPYYGNTSARKFPYEYIYELLRSKVLEKEYQIEPENSWVLAACEKNIPIITPGWEDSTLGNIFTGYCLREQLDFRIMRSGIELMMFFTKWYQYNCVNNTGVGFFQIGGGIAGDFPICVVPMLQQDMQVNTPLWSYFCQITDTNESYGSYSGANPTEKITWGKLGLDTPKFSINSDATIVAPLIFAYVLEM
jgi:deoxyhypusine synthase